MHCFAMGGWMRQRLARRAVSRLLVGGLVAGVCLLGSAASAWAAWGFESPSRNIVCGAGGGSVVCLINHQQFVKPRPCDGDYTADGVVRSQGRGIEHVGCFGGVPFAYPDPMRPLPYGRSLSYRGIVCTSRVTGVECRNRQGHGFLIRRAGLRLF